MAAARGLVPKPAAFCAAAQAEGEHNHAHNGCQTRRHKGSIADSAHCRDQEVHGTVPAFRHKNYVALTARDPLHMHTCIARLDDRIALPIFFLWTKALYEFRYMNVS